MDSNQQIQDPALRRLLLHLRMQPLIKTLQDAYDVLDQLDSQSLVDILETPEVSKVELRAELNDLIIRLGDDHLLRDLAL